MLIERSGRVASAMSHSVSPIVVSCPVLPTLTVAGLARSTALEDLVSNPARGMSGWITPWVGGRSNSTVYSLRSRPLGQSNTRTKWRKGSTMASSVIVSITIFDPRCTALNSRSKSPMDLSTPNRSNSSGLASPTFKSLAAHSLALSN